MSKSAQAEDGALRSPSVWRILLKDRLAVVGLAVIGLLFIVVLWPEQWLPADPYATSLWSRLQPPVWHPDGDWAHPLGTDGLGRDLLSRMIVGARFSLFIAVCGMMLSAFVGITLGVIAGYFGGRVDALIMRLVDVQLAFPLILMMIAIISVIGPSLPLLIIVLGVSGWAQYARLVRAATLEIKELEYIDAGRALGNTTWRILRVHVLPNVATTIVVFGTLEIARILLLESAISFLGLGVQPPTPSWGTMIADGREHIYGGWWVSTMPGLAICLAVLGFNFLGDGLRDVLDPQSDS